MSEITPELQGTGTVDVMEWLKRPQNTIPLLFVMGATNVGKSTYLDSIRHYPGVGLVEVGKMFRAKYPPEHFQGQAAPAHTQKEAWSMFLEGVAQCVSKDCKVAVIDGQPRNPEQTKWALAMPNPMRFVHLWAPPDVREARARNRDKDDPSKLELSLKRLIDDPRVLFDCLSMIHATHSAVATRDTTKADYVPHTAAAFDIFQVTTGKLII